MIHVPTTEFSTQSNVSFCSFIYADGFKFTAEVSSAQRHIFNTKSPVGIIAHTNLTAFIERYKAIYDARECPLFEGIVNPSKLRNFSHSSGISEDKLGIHPKIQVS